VQLRDELHGDTNPIHDSQHGPLSWVNHALHQLERALRDGLALSEQPQLACDQRCDVHGLSRGQHDHQPSRSTLQDEWSPQHAPCAHLRDEPRHGLFPDFLEILTFSQQPESALSHGPFLAQHGHALWFLQHGALLPSHEQVLVRA
jgi:hypothetical protein